MITTDVTVSFFVQSSDKKIRIKANVRDKDNEKKKKMIIG